jgi:Flp pilus assembly protein TadG
MSRSRRSGAAAVEFAFICIPLLTFIVAAIELGRAMMVVNFMSNAARQACRYAVVHASASESDIEAVATHALGIAMVYKVNNSGSMVYYYSSSSNSYDPPSALPGNSPWTQYQSTTTPTTGDYVGVHIQVKASDVSWMPVSWFLKSAMFTANESMVYE